MHPNTHAYEFVKLLISFIDVIYPVAVPKYFISTCSSSISYYQIKCLTYQMFFQQKNAVISVIECVRIFYEQI